MAKIVKLSEMDNERRKKFLEDTVNRRTEREKSITPIISPTTNTTSKNGLWEDIQTSAHNLFIQSGSSLKQVFNFIESANSKYSGYDKKRTQQYLTSDKVSKIDKSILKAQNNPLYKNSKELSEQKVETNLVKEGVRQSIQADNQKIQENHEKISNKAMKVVDEATTAVGQVLPGMALSMVNPILGMGYFTTSAGGAYIDDARSRGMNEDEAFKYGTVMGILEGAVDSVGAKLTTNVSKTIFKDQFKKGLKHEVKSALKAYGLNIAENVLEEAVMEPISEFVAEKVGGKDKANWENMGQRMIDSGLMGGLVGAILGGGSAVIGSAGNVIANSNQTIEQSSNQSTTREAIQNNTTINYQYQKSDNAKVDALRQDMSKYWKNTQEAKNLGAVIEKVIEDKDYNIRLDENITNQDGQSVNAQITTLENGEVEIKINPNAQNVGEFLLAHEITHAIETPEMVQLITDYASKNPEFNQALESLKQTYKTEDVTSEVVADISAQLFGNQEFINSLSMEKPNVFQKIYSKIIEIANKLTGNSKEALFIRDLKNKWQEAYRTQNNNLENSQTKYHVSENFSNEIDKALRNELASNTQVKARDYTPKILVDNGVSDLPMLITQKHIKSTIYTLQQAQKLNLPTKNINYHGLGKELLVKAIDNLDNPKAIYKTSENNYLIVTEFKDSNNREIIIPIQINGKGRYNNVFIDENQIKSVYGRNNLDKYIKNNNFTEIYTKNEEVDFNEGVQYSNVANSSSNSSIPSTKQNVNNNTTKNSMQNSKNNTQDLDLPSKKTYSLPTKEWSEYIQSNYKPKGTTTNLQDIRLPRKEDFDGKTKQDNDVDNKIAELLEHRPEREKKTIRQQLDDTLIHVTNRGHYVDKLAKLTGNMELTYKYDKMLSAEAEGQYIVGQAQTDNNGKKIGKSINEIWEPVEKEGLVKEFSDYLLHKHNYDRMSIEKRAMQEANKIVANDKTLSGLSKSQLKQLARKNIEKAKTDAQKQSIMNARKVVDLHTKKNKPVFGDTVTAETSAQMTKNYDAMYPQFKEWSKDVNTFNKNQRKNMVEGGLISQEIEELLSDMYSNYVRLQRSTNNKLGNSIVTNSNGNLKINNQIKKATGGNSDILPLKDAMAQQAIEIKKAIRRNDFGQELLNTLKVGEKVEEYGEILTESKKGEAPTFTVFKDGQAYKMSINEGLYEALKPNQPYSWETKLPARMIQQASKIQRAVLTTKNPIFIVTNFFKDIQDGWFNSKYSSKFIQNYGKALVEIAQKGEYYNQYMANGGSQNTYFDYETGTKLPTKNAVKNFVQKISDLNEIVEQAPRLAEFISTREAGGSVTEAMYNAAEVTTNFKRGGDLVKIINRNGVNFLNASIQGLSKQYRNLAGQNGIKGYCNILLKATLLGVAPAVVNHMLLDDDEDYQNLPDYIKDTHYLFKMGDDKFIKIPKGRVLSVFGSTARRMLEYTGGEKDAFKGLGSTISNQVAPSNPLTSNIWSPLLNVASNKAWHGGDIVPTRLQGEMSKNQYDESTDNFSKWLGNLTGLSPMKINYVLDQYSGGIGDIVLPMLTPQAENNVLSDKFTVDSILKNKNVTDFYNTVAEQEGIANDSQATDADVLGYKYLASMQGEVSELYKQKRDIENSQISDKEKKEKVKVIQKQINDKLKEALNTYQNGNIAENYGTIGNYQYYKDNDGVWQKLSENDMNKNKEASISLETYSNFKRSVEKETQTQRENGTISKNQSLKNKDKINLLLNGKYTTAEKKKLYRNYILSGDEEKTTFDLIEKTGIKIDAYLDYKLQEFTSDKEDDGTVDGKTISGSAKKKFYQYMTNTQNTNYEDRLLLTGMNYKLTTSERGKLYEYINSNNNLTKNEKLELFGKIKGFTVYKNGTITY